MEKTFDIQIDLAFNFYDYLFSKFLNVFGIELNLFEQGTASIERLEYCLFKWHRLVQPSVQGLAHSSHLSQSN